MCVWDSLGASVSLLSACQDLNLRDTWQRQQGNRLTDSVAPNGLQCVQKQTGAFRRWITAVHVSKTKKRSAEQVQRIWFYGFWTNSKGHTGTSTHALQQKKTQHFVWILHQVYSSANVSLMRNLSSRARGRGGQEEEKKCGISFYSLCSIVYGWTEFTSFHDTAAARHSV